MWCNQRCVQYIQPCIYGHIHTHSGHLTTAPTSSTQQTQTEHNILTAGVRSHQSSSFNHPTSSSGNPMLCWSSTSPNTQNQLSVRARGCTQISQRERRGSTFCTESMYTSHSVRMLLNPVPSSHLVCICALQTVQCRHEPVRKVRLREKGMISPDDLKRCIDI